MVVKLEEYDFPCQYDKPFSHQVSTFMSLLTHKRMFLLSTMGTGKTLSVLWAADFLMTNKKVDRVLIVAPLSILGAVWQREVLTHMPHRTINILHGNSKRDRIRALNSIADFYVINHDGIKVMEKELVAKGFNIMVIDELTAFKSHTSGRSKCMSRVADSIDAVWGMTGNPTAQSPVDAWSQANIVNPDNPDLNKHFSSFRDSVVEKDPYLEYKFVPKLGWQDVVFKALQPAVRFELRDCIDMPPTIFEEREVPMSKQQKDAYKEMAELFITQIDEGTIYASNAGVKHLKLLQISAGSAISDEGVNLRLDCDNKMKELVTIFEEAGGGPTIVCATFVDTVKHIESTLSKKYRTAMVYGGVKAEKRWEIFEKFQKGEYDFLVIQPRVASHGLTLTAASTMIWYSPYPGNEVEQQTNSRIIRPGQKKTQLVVKLMSSPVEKMQYKNNTASEGQALSIMSMIKKSTKSL